MCDAHGSESLAERCRRLLNGEELDSGEIPSFVEESPIEDNEESSEWDSSWEMSVDEEPTNHHHLRGRIF